MKMDTAMIDGSNTMMAISVSPLSHTGRRLFLVVGAADVAAPCIVVCVTVLFAKPHVGGGG